MSEIEIQKYVIFDHDGGTDDAWALLMLLQAEKHLKNIKLLAITCVNGNTTIDNVIKNTYHILCLMGRTDVSMDTNEIYLQLSIGTQISIPKSRFQYIKVYQKR